MSPTLRRVSAKDGVVVLVYRCHVVPGLDDVFERLIDF